MKVTTNAANRSYSKFLTEGAVPAGFSYSS